MTDYEYPDREEPTGGTESREGREGPSLPGGISVETAATGLLVVVLIALLWLFLGPSLGSDDAPGLPSATPLAGGTVARGAETTGTSAPAAEEETTPEATESAGSTTIPEATSLGAASPVATSATGPTSASVGQAPAGLVPGGFARISGTEGMDLRFRFGPGIEYLTIRIAEEGENMKVLAGPENADGAKWWRLQDSFGNVGWAAEDFLVPIAPPSAWNPPQASPTFPPRTGSEEAAP